MEKRDTFADILKGIGIISVVIGHTIGIGSKTGLFIGPYVYTYHLAIFFFVAGYCFDLEKYRNSVNSFVGKRIIKIYSMFFFYNCFFVILHNFLCKAYFIESEERYDITAMLIRIGNGLLMGTSESMMGACWFLCPYVLAVVIYGIIMIRIEKYNSVIKMTILFSFITFCSFCGVYFHYLDIHLKGYLEDALLAIPFIWIGFLYKNYHKVILLFLKRASSFIGGGCINICLFVCSICAMVLEYWCMKKKFAGYGLGLQSSNLVNCITYYPATCIGILFCILLAMVFSRIRFGKIVEKIGTFSFQIMVLHFMSFKLVDACYGRIRKLDSVSFSRFPTSYNIWYIYIPIGILLPILCSVFFNKIKSKICKNKHLT